MKIKNLPKNFATLCLLSGIGLAYSVQTFALAQEAFASQSENTSTLNDNSLSFSVNSASGGYWGTFKWKENEGDNSVSLAPSSGGNIIEIDQIASYLFLSTVFNITVRNPDGTEKYSKSFNEGSSVRTFATEMSKVKLQYGKDSIQVTFSSRAHDYSVLGPINNNLSGVSFSSPTKANLVAYALVPYKEGLSVIYIDQDKIADGNYTIKSLVDQNKYLSYNAGNNVSITNTVQEWNVKYDTDKKAYQILPSDAGSKALSWSENSGNNVFIYDNGSYADQFWYFKKTKENTYKIISAFRYSRLLNVDTNRNVSVAEGRNNDFQQFEMQHVN